MATKKKTAVKAKSTAKPKAAKSAVKKAPAAKTTKKTAPKSTSRPAGPREQKLASSALKLVDEAAALLRKGIHTGADSSEKTRLAAKKRAHTLLTKATGSLTSLLDSGSSALHKVIGKI